MGHWCVVLPGWVSVGLSSGFYTDIPYACENNDSPHHPQSTKQDRCRWRSFYVGCFSFVSHEESLQLAAAGEALEGRGDDVDLGQPQHVHSLESPDV